MTAALAAFGLLTVGSAANADTCAQPEPVCAARGLVFRIEAYDPSASAVRIGKRTLVTNRHVVADRQTVIVHLPDGTTITGRVVPTSLDRDLALILADLPDGPVMQTDGDPSAALFTVGIDARTGVAETHPPGWRIAGPDPDGTAPRLHSSAFSEPGNSGGALVDVEGRLVGIVTSGGEGRFEAIPEDVLPRLLASSGAQAAARSISLGVAYRDCDSLVDTSRGRRDGIAEMDAETLVAACVATRNRQLIDLAAQELGRRGRPARAVDLFRMSLGFDPAAINTRVGLTVALVLVGDVDGARSEVSILLDTVPDDAGILRLGVDIAKRGGDAGLRARVLDLIERHHPQQLEAARRFLNL